jgi:hypothetical protein
MCDDGAVARIRPGLRPVTVALAVFEAWRRLPPAHRRRLVIVARRHGPRFASSLVRRGRHAP